MTSILMDMSPCFMFVPLVNEVFTVPRMQNASHVLLVWNLYAHRASTPLLTDYAFESWLLQSPQAEHLR